ncbi:MAG: hypothetical protein KME08_19335 [Aphanothece sp. CMT-3BRIN-NPC111]|nr:hypothetical protein [Aphanothece sp. CMT-3BRIN-NPC111]
MPPHKAQKIDLNTEYPCPCGRRGRLVPIALTEAFGCNRCQQIFVVQDNGYAIEQLSTTYPYKRSWRWMGNKWSTANTGIGDSYFPVAVGIIVVLLIVWLPLALRSTASPNIILWTLLAVLLAVLPALMVWLAYRR